MASEVSFTSKLSQKASITYVTKFQGILISQKMTLLPGVDDNQRPLAFDTSYKSNKLLVDLFVAKVPFNRSRSSSLFKKRAREGAE